MSNLIYLDHAAATPTDPRVLEVMLPYFSSLYANPSSIYQFGQKARAAVDRAREKTAEILGCTPKEVLFTSGGTESNNLFLIGAAEFYKKYGKHIITTKIEHDSVLEPMRYLESQGFEVTYLDVGEKGIVDPRDVEKALRKDTIFVSIMYANNEIGTIQPIQKISQILRVYKESRKGSLFPSSLLPLPLFHTDACQAAAYLDLSVKKLGVDAMTLNGGKIYGPKGVGVLYHREGVTLVPQLRGGGQEYRLRSGTENVPATVGFAKALELVKEAREAENKKLVKLRDKLIQGIITTIPESRLNGDPVRRLPGNVNVSFRGLEGETILLRLDMIGIAASSGSACTSGSLEPSHVIRALGLSDEWTHSSTRFTLGRSTTEKEIDFLLKNLPNIIAELRETSPFL